MKQYPPLDPNLEVGPRPERGDDEPFEDWKQRQREWAIRAANKKRAQLKVLRRAMRMGVVDDTALVRGDLNEWEPLIANWKIERLLRSCRWIGPNRSAAILEAARIPPARKVGDLPFEKRVFMAQLMEELRQGYVFR